MVTARQRRGDEQPDNGPAREQCTDAEGFVSFAECAPAVNRHVLEGL